MAPDDSGRPDGEAPKIKGKTLEQIKKYVDSFNRLGERIDQLTTAVEDLTDVVGLFVEGLGRASQSARPLEFLTHFMNEVLRRGSGRRQR